MRTFLTLFILAATCFTLIANAQDGSEVTFKGLVTINHRKCPAAELILCQSNAASPDCVETVRLVTEKNGQFEFKLAKDSSYRILVKKDGFKDRTIIVNTTLPKDVIDPSKLVFEVEVELTLYPEAEEPITVASVFFDAEKGKFDYTLPQK